MIVGFAPNPALDRVAVAASAREVLAAGRNGGPVRASELLATPGGKAVHSAIISALLGARACVIAPLGGPVGDQLAALMEAESAELVRLNITGETRSTYTLVDLEGGEVLEVIEPSPCLARGELDELLSALTRVAARGARAVVASGSLPEGAAPGIYADVVERSRRAGALAILDAGGEPLLAALAAEPDLVKPNLTEARIALGDADLDASAAARGLVERGARAALVTSGGADAALAVRADCAPRRLTGTWVISPPPARHVNAVGCGDAVAAGYAVAAASGATPLEAACAGIAVGAAKLEQVHPARIDPRRAEKLRAAITYRRSD